VYISDVRCVRIFSGAVDHFYFRSKRFLKQSRLVVFVTECWCVCSNWGRGRHIFLTGGWSCCGIWKVGVVKCLNDFRNQYIDSQGENMLWFPNIESIIIVCVVFVHDLFRQLLNTQGLNDMAQFGCPMHYTIVTIPCTLMPQRGFCTVLEEEERHSAYR